MIRTMLASRDAAAAVEAAVSRSAGAAGGGGGGSIGDSGGVRGKWEYRVFIGEPSDTAVVAALEAFAGGGSRSKLATRVDVYLAAHPRVGIKARGGKVKASAPFEPGAALFPPVLSSLAAYGSGDELLEVKVQVGDDATGGAELLGMREDCDLATTDATWLMRSGASSEVAAAAAAGLRDNIAVAVHKARQKVALPDGVMCDVVICRAVARAPATLPLAPGVTVARTGVVGGQAYNIVACGTWLSISAEHVVLDRLTRHIAAITDFMAGCGTPPARRLVGGYARFVDALVRRAFVLDRGSGGGGGGGGGGMALRGSGVGAAAAAAASSSAAAISPHKARWEAHVWLQGGATSSLLERLLARFAGMPAGGAAPPPAVRVDHYWRAGPQLAVHSPATSPATAPLPLPLAVRLCTESASLPYVAADPGRCPPTFAAERTIKLRNGHDGSPDAAWTAAGVPAVQLAALRAAVGSRDHRTLRCERWKAKGGGCQVAAWTLLPSSAAATAAAADGAATWLSVRLTADGPGEVHAATRAALDFCAGLPGVHSIRVASPAAWLATLA